MEMCGKKGRSEIKTKKGLQQQQKGERKVEAQMHLSSVEYGILYCYSVGTKREWVSHSLLFLHSKKKHNTYSTHSIQKRDNVERRGKNIFTGRVKTHNRQRAQMSGIVDIVDSVHEVRNTESDYV